jgi:sugar O-acyltransferase (sialic acid O-acetyltransferase NeuD family)
MANAHVLVIGAGGHAKVVIATLQAAGRVVDVIVDEDESRRNDFVLGVQVVGSLDCIREYPDLDAIIAVEENETRRRLATELALNWTTAIHPRATVDEGVTLGPGTIVFAGAVVQPGSRVGAHTIINTSASVDHDCNIGSFVHIAPGVHLEAGVSVEDGAFVGIGSVELPNCRLGKWAVLGAGAVANRNIDSQTVSVGVPTRRLNKGGEKALHVPLGSAEQPGCVHSNVHSQFIGVKDQRWGAMLREVPHDFYHLPGYVALCGRESGAAPLAFYSDERGAKCLIPLLWQSVLANDKDPRDWSDLYSPYGYASPLFANTQDDRKPAFLENLRTAADEIGVCSVFMRMHPLLEGCNLPPIPHSRCVEHGETVFIDLTSGVEEFWRQTRHGHRYDIRRLEKLNFVAVMDDWSLYPEFRRLYRQTMARIGANETYFFTDEYFTELKDALGDQLHLCCVLSPDSRVAASALFSTVGGIMQYHLSASAPEFQRLAPTKLMLHFARLWGKTQGCTTLHLGGGVGGSGDSLMEFKAGFSHDRKPFYTIRMIVNERRYAALILRAGLPLDPEADLQGEYFPPYHRDLPLKGSAI